MRLVVLTEVTETTVLCLSIPVEQGRAKPRENLKNLTEDCTAVAVAAATSAAPEAQVVPEAELREVKAPLRIQEAELVVSSQNSKAEAMAVLGLLSFEMPDNKD